VKDGTALHIMPVGRASKLWRLNDAILLSSEARWCLNVGRSDWAAEI